MYEYETLIVMWAEVQPKLNAMAQSGWRLHTMFKERGSYSVVLERKIIQPDYVTPAESGTVYSGPANLIDKTHVPAQR